MKALGPLSTLVPLTAWIIAQGCWNDNKAAYQGILGETRVPSVTEQGGEAGAAETPGGGGNDSQNQGEGGAANQGGEAQADAGAADSGGGSEAQAGAGEGNTGDNPDVDPDSPYYPPCYLGLSQSGEEIKKGTPCTPEDPQLCYRPCGPDSVGWKTETCLAAVYAEGDCTFPPDEDYSCFAIPDEIDESLCNVVSPPKATDECDAPACTACNFGGQYKDTGDNAKDGYCVCRDPDENGSRSWTCASTTAWPCPFNQGC